MQDLHTNGFCLLLGRCGNDNNAKNYEGKANFESIQKYFYMKRIMIGKKTKKSSK